MERDETPSKLTVSPEKAFFIIVKAREFDEKVEPSEPDPGSDPSDDKDVEVLEDRKDDPTLEELAGALSALNKDEQLDVLALVWLGRGDFAWRKPATLWRISKSIGCECASSWR